jgi:hypothetical protein
MTKTEISDTEAQSHEKLQTKTTNILTTKHRPPNTRLCSLAG